MFYLFLALFLLAPGVSAQEEESTPGTADSHGASEAPRFGLAPVGNHPQGFFEDIEVRPGESIVLEVAVINVGNVRADVRTFKVNALNSVNGGFLAGLADDEPLGAAAWIDYPEQVLSLEPGEQRIVEFSVSVPEGTAPGQYIAGLYVQTADSLPIPGTEVLNQFIGHAISVGILVPGDISHGFELGTPLVEERWLSIPVRNTGNYLVRPEGQAELLNADGDVVLTAPIRMGSVYGGYDTSLLVSLPEQLPPGDYALSLSLHDAESGVTAFVEEVTVAVPEPVDPTGVYVSSVVIDPNAEEIVFAIVDIVLDNGGQQVPAANVTLEIMRDGELVDEFPLATNQVLLHGENQYTTRYIPAEMWESGTYNFNIVVSAVDPSGGQETILLDEELDATIEVP